MINRCHNPTNASYHDYGGRGIAVCDRWRNDFLTFLADMGPRPSPSHSVERRDNDKGYEPGNCHWATMVEQNNNKRNNRIVEYRGSRTTLAEAMRSAGTLVHLTSVEQRIDAGWAIEDAVEKPQQLRGPDRKPRVRRWRHKPADAAEPRCN
jgi:hypothetical protein